MNGPSKRELRQRLDALEEEIDAGGDEPLRIHIREEVHATPWDGGDDSAPGDGREDAGEDGVTVHEETVVVERGST